MLAPKDFLKAIELTQLVSIDLIVLDESLRVLVGKRVNKPAQNTWFVPGSRLYKNETIEEGVKRVSRTELGVEIIKNKTTLIGVYDHIYPDNFLDGKDENGKIINTHYVVIGLQTQLQSSMINEEIFLQQHSEMRWMSLEELLQRPDVDQRTKNYFS